MTKSIFASKTFWFGILQIALGIYGLVTSQLEPAQAITLITTGAGTIGFRTVTNTPVSL